MGDISQWSSNAETGYQANTAAPDGSPENHNASATNNVMRETMAAVRRQWEDKEWFDYGEAPTFLSASIFQVPDTYAPQYVINRRVRATVGGSFVYGTISNVLQGAGVIDVTLAMDNAQVLAVPLTAIALGGEPLAAAPPTSGGEPVDHPDPHLLGDGTSGAPTYSYASAPDTGWFLSGDGSIRASIGGTPVLRVDTQGIFVPDGDAANPGLSFTQRNNGLWSSVNTLGFTANGTDTMRMDPTSVRPQLPVRGLDGAVGAPTFSYASAATTGWFHDPATNRRQCLAVDGELTAYFPSNEPGSLRMPNVTVDATVYDATLVLGAGSQFSAALLRARSGDGTSADPNGVILAGRDAAGVDWAFGKAIRWSHNDQSWYIGTADHDPSKDILTRAEIEALIGA